MIHAYVLIASTVRFKKESKKFKNACILILTPNTLDQN